MRWLIRAVRKGLLTGLLTGALFPAPALLAQEGKTPARPELPEVRAQPVPTALQPEPIGPPEAADPQNDPSITAGGPALNEEFGPDGGADAGAAGQDDCAPIPFWQRVPVVQRFPLPGWFILPPAGPGYYSVADVCTDTYRKGPPKYPYPRFSFIPFSMFNVDWRHLDVPTTPSTTTSTSSRAFTSATTGCSPAAANSATATTTSITVACRARTTTTTWNARGCIPTCGIRTSSASSSRPSTLAARAGSAPLPIDVDHLDLLNAFVDVKLWQFLDGPAYFRVGRQELLYGSQRLISPLDFANTRRTFQGLKTFYRSDKLDLDAFLVQPVIPNPMRFDSVDDKQVFSGLWGTYRLQPTQLIDAYVLNLDNANHTTQLGIQRAPINVTTFGSRYAGSYEGNWMWEAEGMAQCGSLGNRSILADATAVGGGDRFKDVVMKPQFWMYYEYASGDKNPNAGTANTFQQLFPFGHYYFGGTDQVGRQNIHDVNGQFVLYPTNWITFLTQYHVLRLDSAFDALYNAAGNAIRRDPTGKAGTDVGEVLNFVVNFHLDKHQDVLLQWTHLYAGQFIRKTGSPGDLNSVYLQYSYRW